MPIDPRISLGVQPLQIENPLARYGQAQNILAAQAQMRNAETQQQAAQMQMEQTQRQIQQDEDYVTKMAEAIGKNGGPTDMMQAARVMAGNRNPQVSATGIQMLQSLQRLDAAKKAGVYGAIEPKISPVAPAPGALGSGTFDTGQPPILSPREFIDQPLPAKPSYGVSIPVKLQAKTTPSIMAAPPPAPVNQLAPAPVTPQANVNALRAEYMKLSEFSDLPGVKDRMDLIKAQLTEAGKLYTVGGNLVTGTGQPIYTAPPTETELKKNFKYAKTPEGGNFKGTFAEFKAISTPKTSVTYGPQEKAEKVEYGKFLVDQFKVVNDSARIAAKSLPAIESNLATLDKGFDTGFGTEAVAAGARVLGALGVEKAEDFATNAQTFLASASAAVLQRQLEQKGPQTESDAQRITATGAQLGNTKEANRFVLNVAKAQFQRDIEQRTFYAKWREKNKTLEGAEDAWFAGPGSKSLFDSPVLKKYSTNAVDQIPGQSRAALAATTGTGGFKYLGKESK